MNKLTEQLSMLEKYIAKQEVLNTAISASSVGWHIEHSLLVIDVVIEDLQKSNAANYKWKLNFNRLYVFTLNRIPRGKAKARSIVAPKIYNLESLKAHLLSSSESIKNLTIVPADKYLAHPVMGHLKLKDAIKFLNIHTTHHLKIIEDLIKAPFEERAPL